MAPSSRQWIVDHGEILPSQNFKINVNRPYNTRNTRDLKIILFVHLSLRLTLATDKDSSLTQPYSQTFHTYEQKKTKKIAPIRQLNNATGRRIDSHTPQFL